MLDNSSALIFAKDPRGRYLFVNREFERIARRPSTEILGRTDEEVFPSDVATRFRYNDLRVLHEKRAYEFEEAGDFGFGLRTYLAAKFPLFDAAGEAYAVCGVATDISDRKRLEEALSSAALAVSQSEGEALYRELARYLATILRVDCAFIATHDPTGGGQMRMRAFHMNGETRENFNYALAGTPCEIVMGHGFRYYPARLPELFPIDTDFRDLGFEAYAGHPLTDADGRPLGLIAVVSRSALDQPAFVESVLRIFSVRIVAELERVAAQEALRASQDSYREIFEASEDAVFVHDWDTGAILDANPQACASYGYSLEEFRKLRLADISSGVPPYTEEEGLQLDRARPARGQRALRVAPPQPRRQPALGRGATQGRAHRWRCSGCSPSPARSPRASSPRNAAAASRRNFGRRSAWRRSASSRAASRTTSTTCSPASWATWRWPPSTRRCLATGGWRATSRRRSAPASAHATSSSRC